MSDGGARRGFHDSGPATAAAEIDARYPDLDLGFVDAAVMAYAERQTCPSPLLISTTSEQLRREADTGVWLSTKSDIERLCVENAASAVRAPVNELHRA